MHKRTAKVAHSPKPKKPKPPHTATTPTATPTAASGQKVKLLNVARELCIAVTQRWIYWDADCRFILRKTATTTPHRRTKLPMATSSNNCCASFCC